MRNKLVILLVGALACVQCQGTETGAEKAERKEVKDIAWKAYAQATGLSILAEEGPTIGEEFVLDCDVEGLGKKDDKVFEVRFTVLGVSRTRGLILVNTKSKGALVVFPKKTTTTEPRVGGDGKPAPQH